MRGLLNTVGWKCTLGCAVITLLANFRYGLHVAAGPERWVFAIGGAFLDGLKTVLPIALGTLLLARITVGAFVRLSLGTFFWVGLVAWSLFCAMQLYEMSRAERVGTAEAGKASYQQHKANKAFAEKAIDRLEKARSAELVGGELSAAKHDRLWSRTRECTEATAVESREFCARVARLDAEKLTAKTVAEIKADLATERSNLTAAKRGIEGANLAEVLSITDAGTQGLANAFGVDVEALRYRLALFFATLLELGGSLGGWLLTGGHLPQWRWRRNEAAVSKPWVAFAPEAKLSTTDLVVEPEPEPLTPVGAWAREFVTARKGSFVPSSEMHEACNAWRALHGHKSLNKTAFGKEMTALGIERDKRGGVQIYVDVALVQKPKAQALRLAVSNA